MSHTPTCQTRTAHLNGVDVTYSEPDQNCTDETHQESK